MYRTKNFDSNDLPFVGCIFFSKLREGGLDHRCLRNRPYLARNMARCRSGKCLLFPLVQKIPHSLILEIKCVFWFKI